MMKELLKRLSYAVFPRRCELCGEVVAIDESLCDECKGIERISGEVCEYCGYKKEDCICKTTKSKKPEYKQVVAPFYYKGSVVKAVHRFKDYGYTELSGKMAAEIAEVVNERYSDIHFDYITYVPMTKKRLRKRGYNQSKLLAKDISKKLGVNVIDALIKTSETSSQRGSSAKQRRLNLYGAFDVVDSVDLDGKVILLVDDVKTTGSTLNECSVMLKASGATVYCAALAITEYRL